MPAGASPVAHVAVQRHARQVALEARAVAAAEVADRVRREAELARRQQLERAPAARSSAACRGRSCGCCRSAGRTGRCAAAPRCPSGTRRTASRGSRTRPAPPPAARWRSRPRSGARGTPRGRASAPTASVKRVAVDEAARRQPLQRGRQVGDDEPAAEAGQARERPQPLRDDVRVRRELVVGQGLVVREGVSTGSAGGAKKRSSSSSRATSAASRAITSRGRPRRSAARAR